MLEVESTGHRMAMHDRKWPIGKEAVAGAVSEAFARW